MEDIARIRKANKDNTELVEFIDFNYPELKEPPTERMMKALLWFLGDFPYGKEVADGVTVDELVAWLEEDVKPKLDSMRNPTEWKPTEEEMSAIYRMVYIDGCDDEFEKPMRHLYQDLKREFFDGVSIENMPWNNQSEPVSEKNESEQCKIEKKSGEQIENDEKWSNWLINHLEGYKFITTSEYSKMCDKAIAWLKKLKVQKSSTENTQDYLDMINCCRLAVNIYKATLSKSGQPCSNYFNFDNKIISPAVVSDWLNSLEYRKIWKPTDEQLDMLVEATNRMRADGEYRIADSLESLFKDLHKMEEK
jgi:hypothetical protein